MKNTVPALGYDNIQINSPYQLVQLTGLQISKQPNEHAIACYTGIIPETMADSYIERSTAADQITIVQSAAGSPVLTLFCGRVTQLAVTTVRGVYSLEVTAISGTFDLDVKRRSRSFQDPNLSYLDLFKQVLTAYPDGDLVDNATCGAKTDGLIVQFQETDWEFAKRVASQCGAVLIPDTGAAKPRFWVGLPESDPAPLDNSHYSTIRNLAAYHQTTANYEQGLIPTAFTGYLVESGQYLELGAAVRFQGQTLRVARSEALLRQGRLSFTYHLFPENGIRRDLIVNPKLSGASLEGKVIDRAKDTVKVHLTIDPEQDQATACWFPYASLYTAEGHSGWYCMPELGDQVRLYFPDCDETHAIVQNSVRQGGRSNPKMVDPNVKYFGNTHGKELQMDGGAVTLTAKSGVTLIKLDQAQGVAITSDHELMLTSQKDIVVDVTQKLNIKAQDGIYLFANGSSVIMDGTTDFQGSEVVVAATGPPLPVPEIAATAEAQAETKTDHTANILDAIQLGLDVLGLVPGVGAFADLANAGVAAARGDWLGAGLSLMAAIPIVGDAATAGKLTAKGAKLAGKVAKAAPKLTKAAKVTGKAGLAGYMGYSAVSGVVAAGGDLSQGDYLKAARSLVNAFAAGKSLTRSRKIAGNLESFAGPRRAMKAANKKKYTITRRKNPRCYRKKTQSDHCLGDPVDAIIGEVIVDRRDFALPGRIPLAWDRHYGSQSKYQGLCGHGWETPGDIRLEFEPDGTVLFQDGSGAPYSFKSVPDETPVVEPVDGRILWQEGDYYTVRCQDGLTYYFPLSHEAAERIPVSHVGDAFGNRIEYRRDPAGLREIRFNDGRRIEVTSHQGRITAMHLGCPGQPPHLLVRFTYDAQGNLTAAYDALDVPYRFEYRANLLVRHTNRNGLSFHYEYDRYTPEGRCVHTWGDGGLYEERFTYHNDQRSTEVINSFGVTSFLYDERDLVLEETDSLGGITKYEYDQYGRTTAVINPDGQRTEYAYDPEGNLVKLTRPDGKAITTEFNAAGQPLRVTDPNGVAWKQEWDEQGRLTKQISPLGSISQYQYDQFGQPVGFTDTAGNLTQLVFDSCGNPTRLTNAAGQVTEFTYDSLGRLTRRLEPLRRRTDYQYDAKGRLTKAVLPGGATIACEYDGEDNLVAYRDEKGAVTRLEYCGVNELKRRIQPDGRTVEYHYDAEERLIAITNQRGERYELKRDAVGRIIEEIDYWGQSRRYRYSPAGSLQESVDPLGRSISYRADPLGRILAKVWPDPAGSGNLQSETFKYDANGNLIFCANQDIEIKRFFDLEGKLVREDQGPDCSVAYSYDQGGNRVSRTTSLRTDATTRTRTVNYSYNALGQATSVTIAGCRPLQFNRNQLGQIINEALGSQVRRFLEYDEAGYLAGQKVTGDAGPVFTQEYSYDKTGNLVKKYDSVWGTEQFYYDPMGRITHQIDPVGQVQRYLYDPAGDRLATEAASPPSPSDDQGPTWSRRGELDGQTYCFDRAGNLVERSGAEEKTEFVWDANGRLAQSISNGQVTSYRYDPLGRRIFKQSGDTTLRFVWDGDALLGELRSETKGSGPGDGKTGVDADTEPAETACTRLREWVYYPGSFEPLALVEADGLTGETDATETAKTANERVYYYCNLPNGCPERLLDEDGKIVWAARYDAFGKVKNLPVNEVEQPIRLQGQYFDTETGLAYTRFRYYEPNIGAFVSQDPLGLAAGVNVYAFAPNVLTWSDPLGLSCKKKPNPITDPSRMLPAPKCTDPWMPGTSIKSYPVPKGGMEVEMAVAPGQTNPGGWATRDHITDVNFVRNDLAVTPSFKKEVSGIQKFLIPDGVQVQEGMVGPQIEGGITYPGGANQVQILNYSDRSLLKPIGAVRPIH